MILSHKTKQHLPTRSPCFNSVLVLPFPHIYYLLGDQTSLRYFLLSLYNFPFLGSFEAHGQSSDWPRSYLHLASRPNLALSFTFVSAITDSNNPGIVYFAFFLLLCVSLGSINSLERLRELREIFYLPDY